MRSKISSEDRIKLLTSLRPLENMIKDILKLSEIYSENLLSSDITGENSSGWSSLDVLGNIFIYYNSILKLFQMY